MKKSVLLTVMMVCGLCLIPFQFSAQAGYVSYKVDGVQYKLPEKDIVTFSTSSTDSSDETKKLSKYINLSVMDLETVKYAIELSLHIDLKKKFEPGQVSLSEDIAYYNVLPIGYLGLTRKYDGSKYEWYSTQEGAVGNITITKISGKYIEGTFEGEIMPQYPLTSKVPLKITEGKFRAIFNWQD